MIKEIKAAVTIPVMAKARIGHFVEAQILEAVGIDYIDESEAGGAARRGWVGGPPAVLLARGCWAGAPGGAGGAWRASAGLSGPGWRLLAPPVARPRLPAALLAPASCPAAPLTCPPPPPACPRSQVLTPADDVHHINKHAFKVPFVCGCRDLGEALRRIAEGAAMIRTKVGAGWGCWWLYGGRVGEGVERGSLCGALLSAAAGARRCCQLCWWHCCPRALQPGPCLPPTLLPPAPLSPPQGEAGTGNVVEAVRHARAVQVRRAAAAARAAVMAAAPCMSRASAALPQAAARGWHAVLGPDLPACPACPACPVVCRRARSGSCRPWMTTSCTCTPRWVLGWGTARRVLLCGCWACCFAVP